MKFKVGEFYKTRDGRKVKCLETNRPDSHPIVFMDTQDGLVTCHTPQGRYYFSTESMFDIISEWHDEPQDCPVCGHKAITSSFHCLGTDRRVICSLLDCSFSGPICHNDKNAIEAWNRLRSE